MKKEIVVEKTPDEIRARMLALLNHLAPTGSLIPTEFRNGRTVLSVVTTHSADGNGNGWIHAKRGRTVQHDLQILEALFGSKVA